MFAVLEFWDFFWIAVIVSLFAGGSAAYSLFKPSDAARLRRLEAKADLILKHLGLEYKDAATPEEHDRKKQTDVSAEQLMKREREKWVK